MSDNMSAKVPRVKIISPPQAYNRLRNTNSDAPYLDSRQTSHSTSATLRNSPVSPPLPVSQIHTNPIPSTQIFLRRYKLARVNTNSRGSSPVDSIVKRSSQNFNNKTLPQPCEAQILSVALGNNDKHTTTTQTAWKALDRTLTRKDCDMVDGWKTEIDTLLVYTGLFSAVVTAFCVESFKALKQDPEDVMVLVLRRILDRLEGTSGAAITTPANLTFARRINIMWFSSLVLGLSAAFICILVKQWLREFLMNGPGSPRDNARIREYRFQGFIKWRVPDTIALLPLMLQAALAFFFAGLVDLLWSLDRTVAIVLTVLVSISLFFVIVTTILPSLFLDSPYRSPQAHAIFRTSRLVFSVIDNVVLRLLWLIRSPRSLPTASSISARPLSQGSLSESSHSRDRKSHQNWYEYEKHQALKMDKALDHRIIVGADVTLMDDFFLRDVLRMCINDTDKHTAFATLLDILDNRAVDVKEKGPLSKQSNAIDDETATAGNIILAEIVVDVLTKLIDEDCDEILRLLDYLYSLCTSIPFVHTKSIPRDIFEVYLKSFRLLSHLLHHSGHQESENIQEKAFELIYYLCRTSNILVLDDTVVSKIAAYAQQLSGRRNPHYHRACTIVFVFSDDRFSLWTSDWQNTILGFLKRVEHYIAMASTSEIEALGPELFMKGILAVRVMETYKICDAILEHISHKIPTTEQHQDYDIPRSVPPSSPVAENAARKVTGVEIRASPRVFGVLDNTSMPLNVHGLQISSLADIGDITLGSPVHRVRSNFI
ncbi:hypothetical protein QCA50_011033 [Cerrena zonata]|uniref:DUF6535 domain-containing protein n=1 Tax=Cerrena zonata TaxID=2478898 RepID=A0AAW0G5W5_9APHY